MFESEKHLDYLAIIGNKVLNIECKEGEDGFPWADEGIGIRPVQRQIMNDWYKWGVESWLFILLGNGALPTGKSAYLISWSDWQPIEDQLRAAGMGTLPWKPNRLKITTRFNAQRTLDNFTLGYGRENPGDDIGFFVPRIHPFAYRYPELFFLSPMPYWTMDFKDKTNGNSSNTTKADNPS